MKRSYAFLLALLLSSFVYAQDIELPAPHKTGGMPLMEALAKRSTSRAFDARELSPQQLSDLTWAGLGINRPDGKRTAPSAHNSQEIELYLLLKQGAYVYDAAKHTLRLQVSEDLRKLGGSGDMPVVVLYVANTAKSKEPAAEKKHIGGVESGFVSQNIYLYCASEGLVTGYRISGFDPAALGPKLKLRDEQVIVAAQSVGYPKP
jgi:nitroreductase